MNRELTILIAVVVAVLVYLALHRFLVNRATRRAQAESLSQVDTAVRVALQRLVDDQFIEGPATIRSKSAASDGWGRGVMAFEFVIEIPAFDDDQLQIFRQQLNRMLADYSADHDIVSENQQGGTAFLVTDVWQHGPRVHLNIAYLVNEATIEYLNDLHKIDHINENTD